MDKPISSTPISHIMKKSVWTVDSEESIERVEELPGAHHLSCVPVVDSKDALFGIISASDLVVFHAARKTPNPHVHGKSARTNPSWSIPRP